MSEQPGDANRRVVKKVVKKTVLRPVAPTVPRKAGAPVAKTDEPSNPAAPGSPTTPSQRTTRLTTPARVQAARAAIPTAPAPAAPVEPPAPAIEPVQSTAPSTTARSTPAPSAPVRRPAGAPASAPAEPTVPVEEPVTQAAPAPAAKAAPVETNKAKPPKGKQPRAKKERQPKVKKERRRPSLPSISLPTLPHLDVRGRVADAGYAIGTFFRWLVGRIGAFFGGVGRRIVAAGRWLIGLRLPHLSPIRGSAITGTVVGLLAVAMGWGFYQLFSATLGTQAGGGWGFLAFVFLSFVVFIVGELLLAGFGIPFSRIISILAVLLVLLVILVFFLNLAAGIWAWLLIPTLCALMFMAAAFTVITVSQEKNDQRLPWEPTDESQVKTD